MTALFTANTKQDAVSWQVPHFLKSMMKSLFGQNDPRGERNEYAGMPLFVSLQRMVLILEIQLL